MALPDTRDETPTPASPISSNLAAKLQDCVIGGKYGPRTVWTPPVGYKASANLMAAVGYASATADAAGFSLLPLEFAEGDTILGLKLRALGVAVGNITLELIHWKEDGTSELYGDPLVVVAPPAAWGTYSVTFAAPILIAGPISITMTALLAKNGMAIAACGRTMVRR